jgi:hypothetical protein
MSALPVNRLPVNLEALSWLREARADISPSVLYLSQLAWWGKEKGVTLRANKIDPHVLSDQVDALQGGQRRPKQSQENAFRWLLSNPNGPPLAEQVSTLERALKAAESPLEAAQAVLETVSDRMAADRATSPD